MSLRGLPDLGALVLLDGGTAGYASYEEPAIALVAPRSLRIARRPDTGRYDFVLERFRPKNMTWPEPHAVLTMTLEPERPMDAVLAVVRAERPDARVAPVMLAGGTLTMAGLGRSTQLGWDGLGPVTWSERLTVEEFGVVSGAIGGAFPELRADAVVEIRGVGARAAVIATLNPQALSDALVALHAAKGRVLRRDVLEWLRIEVLPAVGEPGAVLTAVTGTPPREDLFADVLADRIRARWEGWLPPAPEAPGTWEWDLAEPVVTWREHLLTLPLFEAFTEIAAHLDDYQPPGVDLDPVPVGWRTVWVLANLPTRQSGMVACGVDLTAPPKPPARPQAVTATVELTDGRPTGHATLRLAPGEDPAFVRQTWAVVAEGAEVRELRGEQVVLHGERVTLRPADFPVRFLAVTVEPALLEIAALRASWHRPDRAVSDFDVRELDQPRTDLAIPAAEGVTVTVELVSRADAAQVLTLGPLPPASLWLGRHLLPSWGPHQIEVTGGFGALVAVALRPETSTGDGEVVTLSRSTPVRTWTWFADDPFRAGYQFRVLPVDAEPGLWSPVRRYDEQLNVAEVPA